MLYLLLYAHGYGNNSWKNPLACGKLSAQFEIRRWCHELHLHTVSYYIYLAPNMFPSIKKSTKENTTKRQLKHEHICNTRLMMSDGWGNNCWVRLSPWVVVFGVIQADSQYVEGTREDLQREVEQADSQACEPTKSTSCDSKAGLASVTHSTEKEFMYFYSTIFEPLHTFSHLSIMLSSSPTVLWPPL